MVVNSQPYRFLCTGDCATIFRLGREQEREYHRFLPIARPKNQHRGSLPWLSRKRLPEGRAAFEYLNQTCSRNSAIKQHEVPAPDNDLNVVHPLRTGLRQIRLTA